jgi:hypothetical protein
MAMHNKTTFGFVHFLNDLTHKPMYKLILLALLIIVLQACSNKQSQEPAPDRVITDTLAQQILRTWDLPSKSGVQRVNTTVTPQEQVLIPFSKELAEAYTELAPQDETFLLNTRFDNTIHGKKGTAVFFPAQCFAKNGADIEGEVLVQLKECYSANDLWQQHINSNSNTTVYSTKGAVSILAFYKGQTVDLKEGMAVLVSFDVEEKVEEKLLLTVGVRQFDGTMQWKTLGKVNHEKKEMVTAPKLFLPELRLADYLTEKINYPDEAKRNELSEKVTATIEINQQGAVEKVMVNSPYKIFRDELESTIYAMPKFTPAHRGNEAISCKMAIEVNFDIRQKQQVSVSANERDMVYLFDHQNTKSEPITISSTLLGWLACQELLLTTAPTAQVVLPKDQHTDFKLILKSKNVVLAAENYGSHAQFSSLPSGEKATLVG